MASRCLYACLQCSLRGGEGSVLGVVLGTILLQVLQNLVNLLGIPSSLNFAVIGGVILIGVLADQQLVAFRRKTSSLHPSLERSKREQLSRSGRMAL